MYNEKYTQFNTYLVTMYMNMIAITCTSYQL